MSTLSEYPFSVAARLRRVGLEGIAGQALPDAVLAGAAWLSLARPSLAPARSAVPREPGRAWCCCVLPSGRLGWDGSSVIVCQNPGQNEVVTHDHGRG